MQSEFIKKGLILTIITFAMRIAGTVFTMFVSGIIGSEGIGLFQLVSSVYMLFVTLATSGISLAVTRIVSEKTAVSQCGYATAAFKKGIILSVAAGTAAAAFLFIFGGVIGKIVLKESRTILPIKILSVGLPFLSVAGVIRGYFTGLLKPFKASAGDIVEQLVVVAVTIPLLLIFKNRDITFYCCVLVIGSVIGEALSCIYSIFLYLSQKRIKADKHATGVYHKILSIAVPVAAGNYVRSALTTIENILVPISLRKFGESASSALSKYGGIKGMALPLLMLPSAIMAAFASLLIPEVSATNAQGNKSRIDNIVNRSIKITAMFSIFVAGMFLTAGESICNLVYHDKAISAAVLLLTPLLPLMYLDMVVDSILKGLNQQLAAMKYNIADSVMRTLLIFMLVPICGIKGYYIMLYAGTIFNATLSLLRLIKVSQVRFRLFRWVISPLLIAIASFWLAGILIRNNAFIMLVPAAIIYILLLRIFNLITKNDLFFAKSIFKFKNNKETS